MDGTTFQQKLHLIYLINDILHHCVRKNANDLKNSLENVVIPMFCSADLIATTEQRAKLTKLLSLWESKAKFFDACVISKLQSPDSSMHEYKTNLQNLHHEVTAKFTQAVKAQLDNYQKQHKIFIQHATQQITQLEQQKQQLEQQMLAAVMPNTSVMPPTSVGQQQQSQHQQPQQVPQQLVKNIPSLMAQKVAMPVMDDNDHRYGNQQGGQQQNNNFFIPDLSKPPPGFMSGNANIAPVTQMPALMQQAPFAHMNSNIPVNQNLNNPPPNLLTPGGDLLGNVNNLNVDLLNVNAALQLVQQQQQQQQQHNDYQIRYRPTSTTTPTILPTTLQKPSTSNCLLTTTILETLKFCDPTATTASHLQYNLPPYSTTTATTTTDYRGKSTISFKKILQKSEHICCWLKSSFQFTILLFIILLLTKSTYANNNIPEDAVHITAILGEGVIFNCHVEFPNDHPVPYVLQWDKKVSETGSDLPIYIWYESYPEHIEDGYKGRVSRVSPDSPFGSASLNLTNIKESDQGWYECKVVFLNRDPKQHKNGTWFHLDVHAPPRFSVTPDDIIYVNLGDSIILNCQADGTPTPEILWYKDANPVDPSPTVGIFNDGTELRISTIRHEDIGEYTCIARNGEGQVSHTARVIIAGGAVIMPDNGNAKNIQTTITTTTTTTTARTTASSTSSISTVNKTKLKTNTNQRRKLIKTSAKNRIVITVPPTNTTKLEGEKVIFSCEAKAMPGNVTVRWFREGSPVREVASLETRITIRKDGSLIINPVSADDSGQYLCEVTNGIGDPQSASAYLNVEYPAKVTFTPTVQYLPFRLAGVVQCYIKSNPQLQYVTWTKDKRLLEPYQMKDIVVMANGSLLFTRVNEDHQGRYTCTPYNALGTQGSSGPMEVLVRKPPTFTVEPESLYQRKVGDSVEMHCDAVEAEGTQKPTIKWQRQDGGALSDTQRNRVKISGGNITIENLRGEDFGYYQCVVSSEVATLMSQTQLVIEGTQPHAPYNITGKATESSITLQWMPGYSGGSEYKQDYTIWYREAGVNDWQTISVTPSGSTQVTINGLASGTTYEFQVVGRNVLGDGMMSKVMTVRTLEDVPAPPRSVKAATQPPDHVFQLMPDEAGPKPGPPRNLTVTEVSNGFLISWQAPLERAHIVKFYTIKYRTDAQWKTLNRGQIRPEETQYLVKNLVGGRTYYFRVLANSEKSYESSDEVKFPVPARVKHKAITAGVVGGILFFVVAIILSVCAVEICSKRKRRKQEKEIIRLQSSTW